MNASVLILDGDHWQRETLAAALAYEGCHAEHTGDATSAMALLARHPFQLLLIDPSAPTTGGWETIERLVLLHPELPLIVMLPHEGYPRANLLTGANLGSGKPIDFPALRSAMKRALSTPAEEGSVPSIVVFMANQAGSNARPTFWWSVRKRRF